MRKIDIEGKFVEIVKEIYRETWNEILIGEETTERFLTKKRLRQGCPLSSILFNIFINDLRRNFEEKEREEQQWDRD